MGAGVLYGSHKWMTMCLRIHRPWTREGCCSAIVVARFVHIPALTPSGHGLTYPLTSCQLSQPITLLRINSELSIHKSSIHQRHRPSDSRDRVSPGHSIRLGILFSVKIQVVHVIGLTNLRSTFAYLLSRHCLARTRLKKGGVIYIWVKLKRCLSFIFIVKIWSGVIEWGNLGRINVRYITLEC